MVNGPRIGGTGGINTMDAQFGMYRGLMPMPILVCEGNGRGEGSCKDCAGIEHDKAFKHIVVAAKEARLRPNQDEECNEVQCGHRWLVATTEIYSSTWCGYRNPGNSMAD